MGYTDRLSLRRYHIYNRMDAFYLEIALAVVPIMVRATSELNNGMCAMLYNDAINHASPRNCGQNRQNQELCKENMCTSACLDHLNTLDDFDIRQFEDYCEGSFTFNVLRGSHCPPGGCVQTFGISKIWQYGCWCNFDDEIDGDRLLIGSGQPMDTWDGICKNYQQCLRCSRWDAEEGGYNCDPHTNRYVALGLTGYKLDCSRLNPNDECGKSLCSCNLRFLSDIFNLVFDWVTPKPDVILRQKSSSYPNGTFDYDEECKQKKKNNDDFACCGWLPERYPYPLNSPVRQCCKEHAFYNPITQQCCDDGIARDNSDLC